MTGRINCFWRYGLCIAIFQALLACGPSPVSEKPKQQETAEASESVEGKQLVIAFGDSLYAGYRLGPNEGFAPVLQRELRDKGYDVTVQNAGVSGDTTDAGRQRLSFVLDAAKQKPQLVLLGLGGNDMLRGIKAEQTRANLKEMLDELRKREIDVVLTGMLAAPNLGADYAQSFNPIYKELAQEYGVELYPFVLDGVVADPALMLGDNIHPNARGVETMVEGLLPTVEGALGAPE